MDADDTCKHRWISNLPLSPTLPALRPEEHNAVAAKEDEPEEPPADIDHIKVLTAAAPARFKAVAAAVLTEEAAKSQRVDLKARQNRIGEQATKEQEDRAQSSLVRNVERRILEKSRKAREADLQRIKESRAKRHKDDAERKLIAQEETEAKTVTERKREERSKESRRTSTPVRVEKNLGSFDNLIYLGWQGVRRITSALSKPRPKDNSVSTKTRKSELNPTGDSDDESPRTRPARVVKEPAQMKDRPWEGPVRESRGAQKLAEPVYSSSPPTANFTKNYPDPPRQEFR